MICRDFPLLYSAQLDGHATEHDQIALQRHLRECAVCRRSAAEMRSLRADLRALAAPLPSPELTGQIQKRLRQEAAARASVRAASDSGRRNKLERHSSVLVQLLRQLAGRAQGQNLFTGRRRDCFIAAVLRRGDRGFQTGLPDNAVLRFGVTGGL